MPLTVYRTAPSSCHMLERCPNRLSKFYTTSSLTRAFILELKPSPSKVERMSKVDSGQSGSNISRRLLRFAGFGAGLIEKGTRFQFFRPSRKASVPPTCSDPSDRGSRTLNDAAQPTSYSRSLFELASSISNGARVAKKNQKVLGELAKSARNLTSLAPNTFEEPHPDSDITQHESSLISSNPALVGHIEQSIKILQNIDTWIKDMNSRTFTRRIFSRRSDLPAIQHFQDQLERSIDEIQNLMALPSSVQGSALQVEHIVASRRFGERQEGAQSNISRGPIPNSSTSDLMAPITSVSHSLPRANLISAGLNTNVDPETHVPFEIDFEASVSQHHLYQGNTIVQNIDGNYTVNLTMNNPVRRDFGNTYTGQNVNLGRQQPVFQDDQYYDDSSWTRYAPNGRSRYHHI
ncbi:hypothetical protein FB446DRAFT_121509 [Lentinula raphanica]|nr:hypothetical protein FB446DRAFT_121509 [Lentinula raphanica]